MSTPAVLVTGATGGIGKALISNLYADNEPIIIAACRNPERINPLIDSLRTQYPHSSSTIIPHQLDLASFDAVKQSARKLNDSGIRLRALINNAGTMPLLHHVTIDGHEQATQVNYLSTILFTRLLLPIIDDNGTIIFTVSVTRKLTSPTPDFDEKALNAKGRWAHFLNYARSKTLLTHYALALSSELHNRGINVCCSDPGVVDSGIITLGIPVVDYSANIFFRPCISTPAQGAAPALRALAHPENGFVFTYKHTKQIPTRLSEPASHNDSILKTNQLLAINETNR
jgi:NAD(P)-dependent dehydrogenase (short-subunit alcohol dehydrogenase family)